MSPAYAFPPLYPDELLYSSICRYAEHFNLNISGMKRELYSDITSFESWRGPKGGYDFHINLLAQQLHGTPYTPEYLLTNHTLIPLIQLICSKTNFEKRKKILLGFGEVEDFRFWGVLRRRSFSELCFCPVCAEEDIVAFGEPYWHRIHQIRGINICPKHNVCLEYAIYNSYSLLSARNYGAHKFRARSAKRYRKSYIAVQHRLNDMVSSLLNCNIPALSRKDISDRAQSSLYELRLATLGKQIHFNKLQQALKHRYPMVLLDEIELIENAPLPQLFRRYLSKNHVKDTFVGTILVPLLIIDFIAGELDTFYKFPSSLNPFGSGPWECLNPVCENYEKPVIKECTLLDQPPRIAGQVKCKCGYCYRMYRPIVSLSKPLKYASKIRVVTYGSRWLRKFKEMIKDPTNRKSHIRRTLHATIPLIQKARRDNFDPKHGPIYTLEHFLSERKTIRNEWMALRRTYPLATGKQLESNNQKLVKKLRSWDRHWFQKHSPRSQRVYKDSPRRSLWLANDKKLLPKLKKIYLELVAKQRPPRRITIRTFEKYIGTSFMRPRLVNLPLCYKFLNKHIETPEMYTHRRINYFVDYYLNLGVIPTLTKFKEYFPMVRTYPDLKKMIEKGYRHLLRKQTKT